MVSPDPWVWVVGVVAALTYALHGFNGLLSRDLSLYSYAGQQVADGVPPYIGVMNRAGPLAHAIPALGVGVARLGGWDDVLVMRATFLVIAAVCTSAVYVLVRDTFRSPLTGLVGSGAFLTFAGFIHYASNGPREKTPMTLFVVGALWAVTRRRWFAAGVFVSLATLCLQIAFFPTFTAVAVGAVLLARGHRVRALVRVVLGGAVPVVIFGVYFALVGSLRQALDAFLLVNARYTEPDPLLPKLGSSVDDLLSAYGVSVWPIIAGAVALVALPLVLRREVDRPVDPSLPVLTAFAVALVTGLLWNLRDYDAWPDLFPLLPLCAVGIGGLFMVATRRLSQASTLVLVVVLFAIATGTAVYESVSRRDDRLETQRASVAAVLDQLPADATVTSLEAPQPLVLGKKTNPTRYQMFSGGMAPFVDDVWPGGLQAFRRQLVDQPTTLVAVGNTMPPFWRRGLAPEYEYVGSAPDWLWYARTSLGPETLSDLRVATGLDPVDDVDRSAAPGADRE